MCYLSTSENVRQRVDDATDCCFDVAHFTAVTSTSGTRIRSTECFIASGVIRHICTNEETYFLGWCDQETLFWRNTGETPDSLTQIVTDVTPALPRITVLGAHRLRAWRQTFNIVNQVLLVVFWLRSSRKHSHLETIAILFDLDPSSVHHYTHLTLTILWHYFKTQVILLGVAEWAAMSGEWSEFPNTVGCIDGNST